MHNQFFAKNDHETIQATSVVKHSGRSTGIATGGILGQD